MTNTVHPRVLWSGVAGLIYSAAVYELQKRGIWQPDPTEVGFLGVAVSFATGYLKRVDGEDTSDAPLTIVNNVPPPLAPSAATRSTNPDVAALQPEDRVVTTSTTSTTTSVPASTVDDLSIPPRPQGGAAAATAAAIFLTVFLSGCGVTTPVASVSVNPTTGVTVSGPSLPSASSIAGGIVKTVLTDTAKEACAQQALLNNIAQVGGTVVGAAIGIPGAGVLSGAAASSLVGAGCTWVNAQ